MDTPIVPIGWWGDGGHTASLPNLPPSLFCFFFSFTHSLLIVKNVFLSGEEAGIGLFQN